ncbi:putative metal-dependent phosphohydrolase protein [Rhizobium phage RHph_TM3_3_14B]|nr:putative metal-dependent phosphohydrolase protein [Rhizobium phage RHph_TM3_3_14B]
MTLNTAREAAQLASVITFPQKQYNEPVMVEGYGAQPVPPPKYAPANDNLPQPIDESGASAGFHVGGQRGQYIGLQRGEKCNDLGADHPHMFARLRPGDFMQTATGRKFWPMDPRADEVFIEDIAHALSMQCRYAGHCLRFYSVAEHCVLMARKLRWEGVDVALWALLHDASESYLVDVPRPVKPYLDGYKAAEAKVMAAICDRYELAHEMPAVVHDADNRIIADELANLVKMDWHGKHNNPLGVELRYWSPEQAKIEFMATFQALIDNRARGMA